MDGALLRLRAGGVAWNEFMDSFAHTTAVAADAPSVVAHQDAPGGGAFTSQILMMAAIFAIFYFLLIRPQQKEAKQQQQLLAGLQKGDQVVTSSGMHGTVWEVRDAEVVLEIADRVRITLDKGSVKRKVGPEPVSTEKGA